MNASPTLPLSPQLSEQSPDGPFRPLWNRSLEGWLCPWNELCEDSQRFVTGHPVLHDAWIHADELASECFHAEAEYVYESVALGLRAVGLAVSEIQRGIDVRPNTPIDEAEFLDDYREAEESIERTIMFRNSFTGGDGWTCHPLEVNIAASCPICGGPRGEAEEFTFLEDGEFFTVDRWTNLCGHLDRYDAVFAEAMALMNNQANG